MKKYTMRILHVYAKKNHKLKMRLFPFRKMLSFQCNEKISSSQHALLLYMGWDPVTDVRYWLQSHWAPAFAGATGFIF